MLSPDGRHFATSKGNSIRIWDSTDGRELSSPKDQLGHVGSITWTKDGKSIVTTSDDGWVRCWSSYGRVIHEYKSTRSTMVLPTRGYSCILEDWFKHFRIIDLVSEEELFRIERSREDPYFDHQLVGLGDDGVTLCTKEFIVGGRLNEKFRSFRPALWDLDTGRRKLRTAYKTLTCSTQHPFGLTPDSRLLVLMDTDSPQDFCVWDVEKGRKRHNWKANGTYGLMLAFSGESRLMAGVGTDHTVHVWEVITGDRRCCLDGVKASCCVAGAILFLNPTLGIAVDCPFALSPDGRTLAASNGVGQIMIWDLAAGKIIQILQGHLGKLNALVFSRDGRHLASASNDTTVLIWDAAYWEKQPATAATGERERIAGMLEAVLRQGMSQ